MTSAQCRAARALLAWSQRDLAEKAGLATSTVADFERGYRTPVDTSVDALLNTLEQAGVALTAAGAEDRAKLLGVPGARIVPGAPFRWVSATDLANWGGTRIGQDTMPELVMRLIRAAVGSEARLLFPSGDSVHMPGPDGICEVTAGTEEVPTGCSWWEIGTQREKVRSKADDDYLKRTNETTADHRRDITFVFVTPQRWASRAKWAASKRAEGAWRDVRAYDADLLIHWIEMHPVVGHWLASLAGKRPPGLRRLEEAWEEWSLSTEPPTNSDLVLAGRDEEATRTLRWLRGNPSLLSFQANSTAEATAFLHASISALPEVHRASYLSRAFVAAPEQARALNSAMSGLVIVLEQPDPGLAASLAKRHFVYVPVGADATAETATILLPRPFSDDVELALGAMGLDSASARRLAKDSGRSATVIRRLMRAAPGASPPRWAMSGNAKPGLAALLAGSWEGTQKGDMDILQRLAREPYLDVEAKLTELAAGPDSLLWKVGETWKVASPRDAWFTLAAQMSPGSFDIFVQTAIEVLSEPNPALQLAPEDRWVAGAKGIASKYSHRLQKGMAETLALLSIFGHHSKSVDRVSDKIQDIVGALLRDAGKERWLSLEPVLRTLAEVAPNVFLEALEDSLADESPAVMAFFGHDKDAFSGAHHSTLLWALECLAWSRELLPQVARCLAALDRRDPSGRYANRPGNSLRTIFLLWSPQTMASLDERLDIIDQLRGCEPATSWRLMLSLIPRGHDTTSRTPLPRWRNFADNAPSGMTYEEIFRGADGLVGRLLDDAGEDTIRWCEVLEHLTQFSRQRISETVTRLHAKTSSWKDEERRLVREKLRALIHQHRQIQDADWTLPTEVVDDLEAVLDSLAPSDPAEQVAWLFKNDWQVHSLHPRADDWDADARDAKAARQAAVESLVEQFGPGSLLGFAQRVAQPWLVGEALAATAYPEEVKLEVLLSGLQAGTDAEKQLSHSLVAHLNVGLGSGWSEALLDRARVELWASEATLLVLLALPSEPWVWKAAKDFGSEIEASYWRRTRPYLQGLCETDLPVLVRKLIDAKRPGVAAQIASQKLEQVGAGLLMEVLRSCATTTMEEDTNMLHYYLERILGFLDTTKGADQNEIARMEWAFLPLLRHSSRGLTALHGAMAREPTFFVEVLSALYRTDSESKHGSEPEPDEDLAQSQARASRAYELLSSWQDLPGQQGHQVDAEALGSWVKTVRSVCKETGRATVGDNQIGQVLAHAPLGTDGFWPSEAVRTLVETLRNKQIEVGIEIGLRNKRGVTIRNSRDGGSLERVEAERYELASRAQKVKWPRISAVLARIAQSYQAQAKSMDDDVERGDWS